MYPQHQYSSIFKTIQNSIDTTKSKLLLFNKDWNAYKTNWQNAFGVKNKIGSLFATQAISSDDVNAIKAYNTQIDNCVTSQTAFNRTMLQASPTAQNLVASYNGAKVSTEALQKSQIATTISTKALTMASQALRLALNVGLALGIVSIIKGIQYLCEINERYIKSQQEIIEKSDENVQKYNDEIESLKELQTNLKETKGNKVELSKIQDKLNKTIGDTPRLLDSESNAYNIANQRIKDRIKSLEELKKIELENKITAQKEIFDNSEVENSWGIDHKFDYFSKHKLEITSRNYSSEEFFKYIDDDLKNKFVSLQELFENLKKNNYGNGKKSNAEIWNELISSYGGAFLETSEIQDFFNTQSELAKELLNDYIDNSGSIFSKEELNLIIENLVESGYAQDLNEIKRIITSLIENDDLQNLVNNYYNSLYDNEIDSDKLYENIKEQFAELVKKYPELKNILENYFNNISTDIKSEQEEVSKNLGSLAFTNIFSLKTESGEATDLSNLKDNINEITTAYQALSEATEEYRTTGSLSFSTIEKLMESGDEWLNYLTVEDGQLRINEQAYYDMAQAKLYELKVQALQNLSEQVKGLQNTRDAMKWVETQNYDTADSYKTLASEVMNETITELNAKKALAKTDAEKSYWQDTIDMYQQRAEQIDKMFDSVDMHGMLSGGESVLSDTLAQAQKTADLINTVKEEIEDNGKVSVSTLQDIASAYPVLEKYVQDYMAGVEGSEANLIAQLNQMYEQDVNNYKSAWLLKAQYDRNFWVDFQNGSADVVNRLRDQYGVDLKNFASYAQAKQSITAKILEAQAKIVQADLYVMRKTTGDITRSAEVAGLTTDQKRNAQDMWTNWKDEYLNAKLNHQEYLITADQMAQNLEHAGGLNPSSAKDLAKTLYTNLMALGVDSGRGYIDGLKAELDGLDTSFETYSADYADKVSLAFDDPVKLDSSKSDKDTKETFDWIEIKIQRLTELLDKLKTKANNTYASWTSRNTALAQAIDKTYEAINLQSQAYSRYMQEADSVGLSGYYKTLVQNGAIDISTISDETLKDQINEYQTW